jgi:hypothetical protein
MPTKEWLRAAVNNSTPFISLLMSQSKKSVVAFKPKVE